MQQTLTLSWLKTGSEATSSSSCQRTVQFISPAHSSPYRCVFGRNEMQPIKKSTLLNGGLSPRVQSKWEQLKTGINTLVRWVEIRSRYWIPLHLPSQRFSKNMDFHSWKLSWNCKQLEVRKTVSFALLFIDLNYSNLVKIVKFDIVVLSKLQRRK